VDSPTLPQPHRIETTFFPSKNSATSVGTRSVLIFTISKRLIHVHTTANLFSRYHTYLPIIIYESRPRSGHELGFVYIILLWPTFAWPGLIIISSLYYNTYYPYCPCMERVLSQASAEQQSVTSSR